MQRDCAQTKGANEVGWERSPGPRSPLSIESSGKGGGLLEAMPDFLVPPTSPPPTPGLDQPLRHGWTHTRIGCSKETGVHPGPPLGSSCISTWQPLGDQSVRRPHGLLLKAKI